MNGRLLHTQVFLTNFADGFSYWERLVQRQIDSQLFQNPKGMVNHSLNFYQ
jgi:hypothetical protein